MQRTRSGPARSSRRAWPRRAQDRSVLPDLKDCKDPKDLLERKAQPVTGARPAHPALRDRSAPKARRVNPEHKDQPVLPVRAANPGRKGLADRPGLPARSDPREIPAPPQLSASSPAPDQ
jgi:hypothetical protein